LWITTAEIGTPSFRGRKMVGGEETNRRAENAS
jgi:hypothetical protein